VPGYWSVEDLDASCTTSRFLQMLVQRVRDLLPESQRARVKFRREDFKEDSYTAFEQFCDGVSSLGLSKPVLMAIDEFDRLVRLVRESEVRAAATDKVLGPHEILQPQTLGALRKLLMKGGAIRLVLCGLPDLLAGATYEDRLFGLTHRLDLGPFQAEEADAIVEQAEPGLVFPPLVRAHLYEATGLQPYLLQLVCSHIFGRMNASGRDAVTVLDLREVVERDILPYEATFTDYLTLIRPEDRALLRALALAQKAVVRRRRYVTPGEIVQELWKAGESRATVDDVTERLTVLASERRPLVAESGDHRGNFRLVIGLLGERLVRRST
jgi:hypothetical protein